MAGRVNKERPNVSSRASKLSQAADEQISQLIDLLSTRDEAALSLPCPGRGKLGDGSVAACAAHAAGNYGRIADFAVARRELIPAADRAPTWRRRLTAPLASLGHARRHGPGMHGDVPGADEVDREGLLNELRLRRADLGVLSKLTDAELDTIPAASEDMRFCDGQRTVEQVLGGALKHQRHQVEAIRTAL
jgi:hypothetical protein